MRSPKMSVILSLQVGLTSSFVSDCQTMPRKLQKSVLKRFLAVFNTKRVSELF